MAVAIAIEERADGIPPLRGLQQTRFGGYIGERAITVIPVEHVLPVVADEEIVPPVAVVITYATTLTPTRSPQAAPLGDIGEGAVAVVLEKPRNRFLPFGETVEPGPVHQKDVDPVVLIEIEEGDPAPRSLQQVPVFVLPAVNGFDVQSALRGHVHVLKPQRCAYNGRRSAR